MRSIIGRFLRGPGGTKPVNKVFKRQVLKGPGDTKTALRSIIGRFPRAHLATKTVYSIRSIIGRFPRDCLSALPQPWDNVWGGGVGGDFT